MERNIEMNRKQVIYRILSVIIFSILVFVTSYGMINGYSPFMGWSIGLSIFPLLLFAGILFFMSTIE